MACYFKGRAAVVDVRIQSLVVAKIQFILEALHGMPTCGTAAERHRVPAASLGEAGPELRRMETRARSSSTGV